MQGTRLTNSFQECKRQIYTQSMNRHIFTLLIPLLAASPTWATSFVSRPLPETTQKTPTLVRGKIGSSYSDWVKTPDGGKRIYTFYDLQVTEAFKGEPKTGTSIQIREMGGEKDGVGLQISGAAQFSQGEDVVVTLGEKNPDGSFDLRGLMTGKFGVGRDQSGNEILIGATGEDLDGAPEDHHGPWTLNEFRKLVASQSQPSHSEASKTSNGSPKVKSPVMSSPTPRLSVSPSPTTSAEPASQLQPEHDQGAAHWGYVVAAILLLGGIMMSWRGRGKK